MKNNLKFIYKYLKNYKITISIALIIIVLSSLLDLTYGYFNGAAIEEITKLNLKMCLFYYMLYFLISVFSGGFLRKIGEYIINKIQLQVIERIDNDIYKKTLNLPSLAFEEKKNGEFINRITKDAEDISDLFSGLFNLVVSLFGSLLVLIYIFINSYIIGIEIIIFIFILYFIVKYFNPKIEKINDEMKKSNDNYTSIVTESISGIREIKTLGIKKNLFIEIKKITYELFSKKKKDNLINTKYSIIINLFRITFEVFIFVNCAILLYYNKITLTFFIAMTYYIYRYTWIIENFQALSKNYQKTKVAIKRLNEILSNKLYKDVKFGNKKLDNSQKTIEFKNVTFSYKEKDLILNNFSIKLEPNKKIAIVGKSGQGKTTIFNLITRIFDTNQGNIYINDINIKEIEEESLRENISIIRQNPFIFNKTIKENFLLLNKNISIEEIKKCSKRTYIDEYIESLPDKYDTLIGEGGVNLSGGQKQRLAIARTLAKKSKIILFDEATSALDNESQSFIKKSIDDLVKDHTIVIIAHRLSTIIDADIIYVIDNGKVVNSGTHEYLLKNSIEYRELYQSEGNN